MKQRIRRFGVGQTAKVFAILNALIGLVVAPLFLLAAMFAPDGTGPGVGFAIALPILYGVFGFIFTMIGCVIYNLVAGWVGGIEIEMGDPVQ
jgi:hypothetical protein